ncbi:MAG: serine/threonine protein kinase [Lachnospiraceae bacterium]|nr:serine/threonine protein kinase [Lachnospiraceae bacterium]
MNYNDGILGFHSDVLASYKIVERIGEGGTGVVYLAYSANLLNQKMVIKVSKNISRDDGRREATILKSLKHPSIPIIYEYHVENGRAILVMEYVEGRSLQEYLDNNYVFDKKEIYDFGMKLCECIDYLHSQPVPIIHGDIKPDNIIITPDGNISVIDFNISGISENGWAYTYGFTKGYSAPEQENGFYAIQKARKKREGGIEASSFNEATTAILEIDPVSVSKPGKDEAIATKTGSRYGTNTGIENKTKKTGKNKKNKRTWSGSPIAADLSGVLIDRCCDVYSIGATLFRLYSGEKIDKYKGEHGGKIASYGVQEGLLLVIDKAVRKNPRSRYRSAGKMLKDMRKIKPKRRYQRFLGGVLSEGFLLTLLFLVAATGGAILAYYYGVVP